MKIYICSQLGYLIYYITEFKIPLNIPNNDYIYNLNVYRIIYLDNTIFSHFMLKYFEG